MQRNTQCKLRTDYELEISKNLEQKQALDDRARVLTTAVGIFFLCRICWEQSSDKHVAGQPEAGRSSKGA